ncbi:DUF929 domain-containing protein [Sulfuracidifex metallicus]|uniref:DUF929 domain-containing protein n=1 Tax=Sulfuracidifex metallicus TaxID=47303 RepID=UPI002276A8D5|nr:DUF929 domain-containing protein [Sulfuracidifex metallicus]MCY0849848.1 DUF929 domain-containing protein [Sulfuracidifex metallicus]
MNKLVIAGVLLIMIVVIMVAIIPSYIPHNSKQTSTISSSTYTEPAGVLAQPEYNVSQIPFGKFIKVSNQDLAPPGKVEVIEQSWIGCPVGAVASWAIYGALGKWGTFTYYNHTSDPLDTVAQNIPGLIFENFKPNSTVEFHVVYVYNEYLNGSAVLDNATFLSGYPISENQLVPQGEKILNQSLKETLNQTDWYNISSLFIKYETQVKVEGYNNSSAYIVKPPHLNFGMIITGPNGTWIDTTPLISPTYLKGMTINEVWTQLDHNGGNLTAIVSAANYIELIINEASGTGAPVVSCF